MSERRVGGPHRPDVLLNSLGKRLQQVLASEGWSLGALTVCVGGDLRFFVLPRKGPQEGIEIRWDRAVTGGEPVAGYGGAVVAMGSKQRPNDRVLSGLLHAVAATIVGLPVREFELLQFAPDRREMLPFDKQITSRLFGGWLAIGKTRWRGYECAGMSQEFNPPRVILEFEKEGEKSTVELLPRLETSPAHRRLGGGSFEVLARNAAGDSDGIRPGSPGAYVGFLVARRLGPGVRVVEDPTLTSAEETGPEESRPKPWEWGSERGWRRFIHMDEVMDLAEVRRVMLGPHAEVVLGERECHNPRPCSYGPRLEAFDYPALEPWPDLYSGRLLATMVSEKDLIAGPGTLFQDLLQAAPKVAGCRAVVVADTCVSSLPAEDADLLSESVAAGSASAAIESGENLLLRNEHFYQGLLGDRKRGQVRPASSPAVNLVGFLPGPGREELVALLGQCGVRVNAFFLPDIHLTKLEDFASAHCNVLFPISQRQSAYQSIERACGLPGLFVPAPFGPQGTAEWLHRVARHVGRETMAEELLSNWKESNENRLQAASEAAAETPLAFVISDVDVALLTEPKETMGVDLLESARQLGFPVEILHFSSGGRIPPKTKAWDRILDQRNPPEVSVFGSGAELQSLLLAGKARLVFSDARCDFRVHNAGKNTFSLRHFEMGFEGALRMVATLHRRGRNPYFAKYMSPFGEDQERS